MQSAAMKIDLKRKLARRQLSIGSWLSFSFPPLTEMMAGAGFEWLAVDMEHTAIDFAGAQQAIQIIDLAGCIPLVRVGGNDPLLIKRSMDAGAHGVIVPMINSPEDARRAVESVYYPPRGKRGAGLSRAQRYGAGFDEYRSWAETGSILIVQIEHIRAVENMESILAQEGVDGFLVGPYDLSASLNLPGQFDHPAVTAALDEIRRVMAGGSKAGGFHVVHSNREELQARIQQGFTFIAYGADMVFFAEKTADEGSFVRKIAGRI